MKRIIATVSLLLCCILPLTACGTPTISDPKALAEALVSADLYSTEIYPIDPSMVAQIYAVTADFVTAYGHAAAGDTADEMLVITAPDEAGAKTILTQLEKHMVDFSAHCASYNAAQCPRIEGGLLMRVGATVVWCVSNDTDAAKRIVEQHMQ